MIKELKQLFGSVTELITLRDSIALFKLKNRFRSKEMTPVMKTLTFIGNAGLVWSLPALSMLRDRKTRMDGLLILYDIGQNVLINNLVTKLFFHRIRPCVRYPGEQLSQSYPIGYSFPSGHSLTSFSAATLYILFDWRNIFWTLPLATAIAFSRAYLFTHYPSDIITGSIVGVANALVIYEFGEDIFFSNKIFSIFKKYLFPEDESDSIISKIEKFLSTGRVNFMADNIGISEIINTPLVHKSRRKKFLKIF